MMLETPKTKELDVKIKSREKRKTCPICDLSVEKEDFNEKEQKCMFCMENQFEIVKGDKK